MESAWLAVWRMGFILVLVRSIYCPCSISSGMWACSPCPHIARQLHCICNVSGTHCLKKFSSNCVGAGNLFPPWKGTLDLSHFFDNILDGVTTRRLHEDIATCEQLRNYSGADAGDSGVLSLWHCSVHWQMSTVLHVHGFCSMVRVTGM